MVKMAQLYFRAWSREAVWLGRSPGWALEPDAIRQREFGS